jgi:hypothetical protein
MSLYMSNNGMIVCGDHGGMYLKSELTRRPKARKITTPLDHWTAFHSLDEVHPDDQKYMSCEACGKELK